MDAKELYQVVDQHELILAHFPPASFARRGLAYGSVATVVEVNICHFWEHLETSYNLLQ